MDKQFNDFTEKYRQGLEAYVAAGDGAKLDLAYELGRTASADGLSLLKVTKVHLEAMRRLLAHPGLTFQGGAWQAAETFLLEALSPFEAAERGFGQTNVRLQDLNETLTHRNMELAVINRSLENEVGERKRTETALREGEEHYRVLFTEARQMQADLQNLSSQILHVQEEERKRISRELHDEVGQALTAINVHLTALSKADGEIGPKPKKKIAATQRLLQETMETVHRFSRELRPPMLDDLGLIPALRSYVKTFAERTALRTRFTPCDKVEKMDDEQKLTLYRVAQESLTNVAKHAQATRVTVRLGLCTHGICLEIKDNGKASGVNKQAGGKGQNRLGLLGIQERIRLVQGDFVVESKPGKGTTVRVQIPFKGTR